MISTSKARMSMEYRITKEKIEYNRSIISVSLMYRMFKSQAGQIIITLGISFPATTKKTNVNNLCSKIYGLLHI